VIPVPVPSWSLIVVLFISLAAGIGLIGCGLALACSKAARAFFLHRRRAGLRALILMAIVATPVVLVSASIGWSEWQNDRQIAAHEAALHMTLGQTTRIQGFELPAGTRLTLLNAGDMSTFTFAEFPRPITLYGIQATTLSHDSRHQAGADKKDIEAFALKLQGAGDQVAEGWLCDATRPIEFTVTSDGSLQSFDGCTLGAGNKVEGLTIPKEAVVDRSENEDMAIPAYWRIGLSEEITLSALHLPLSQADLLISRQHKVSGLGDNGGTRLARETRVGPMTYPAGTEIQSAGLRFQKPWPGSAWIFSPQEQSAHYAEHADVGQGMSVLQTADGKVVAVVPNEQAGIVHFISISAASQ
jgi:hypothetical protein